jgi:hypothetical protein
MSEHFLNNKEFYNQPIRLSDKLKGKPFKVLKSFFNDYELYEARYYLLMTVECCLTTQEEDAFQNGAERSGLLHLYEKIEELLEAASIIVNNQK